MDTYLTLQEAALITHVDVQLLNQLVESGKIDSVMLTTGAVLVNKKQVEQWLPLHERPEYTQYQELAGNGISMLAAAEQYGVPQQTISRWVASGLIAPIGRRGKAVLLDQAEIATLCTIYRDAGGSQGRWVFKGGKLYTTRK